MLKDKLLIASNNPGKVKEIKNLLSAYNIEIFSITDLNIKEPEETGITFEENAILKAKYYGEIFKLPALADDSGISINELDGYPGVYSARIAGEDKNFSRAFKTIEDKLLKKGLTSSTAFFTCSLALWLPNNTIKTFEGKLEGIVSFPAVGVNGFGYDPIFTPYGYNKKLAELDPDEKNKISHRTKAFQQLLS